MDQGPAGVGISSREGQYDADAALFQGQIILVGSRSTDETAVSHVIVLD